MNGTRRRRPPAKQRVPFVRGCVPEVSGPSHETGRVRLLDQRQASTTASALRQPTGGFFFRAGGRQASGMLFVNRKLGSDGYTGACQITRANWNSCSPRSRIAASSQDSVCINPRLSCRWE